MLDILFKCLVTALILAAGCGMASAASPVDSSAEKWTQVAAGFFLIVFLLCFIGAVWAS